MFGHWSYYMVPHLLAANNKETDKNRVMGSKKTKKT